MTGKIYSAINNIKAHFAREGIPKSQRNTLQNYNFRGIDDVYAALAPVLADNQIDIFPQVESKDVLETESKSGGTLFKTTIFIQYKLIHAEDGSCEFVKVYGEAMDSGDKGMNKAFSAAYKLMAFQTFCIPTGDASADSESEHHETVGSRQTPREVHRPVHIADQDIPTCPKCLVDNSVMPSKYETKWYCAPKKGGCGNAFDDAIAAPTPDTARSPEQMLFLQEEIPF